MNDPTHNRSEIFARADEMSSHPLRWHWEHWFTQSSDHQRELWFMYQQHNPRLRRVAPRAGW